MMRGSPMANEESDLLFSTASRLYEERLGEDVARAVRRGEWVESAWAAIEEVGFPLALLSEDQGGVGVAPADALNLVTIGGYHASPAPLGETLFANWFLASVGLPPAEGPATFARISNGHTRTDTARSSVTAVVSPVPWGRHARTLVLIGEGRVMRLTRGDFTVMPGAAARGLPRDSVRVACTLTKSTMAPAPSDWSEGIVEAAGALMRSLEMAGAMQRTLEITTLYAQERVQFGRPIGKFQAVQQDVAVLAGHVAAANAAARMAAEAFGQPRGLATVAAAKARAGEAAGVVAAIAHQLLGAIGFTEEHRLHLFTDALWIWRDEYGSERTWQQRLGRMALAGGGDFFWPFVTSGNEKEAAHDGA